MIFEELTIEALEKEGIKVGAKLKGLPLHNFDIEHGDKFPEFETVTKIEEVDGIIRINTDFTDSIDTFNDKKVAEEDKAWSIESTDIVSVIKGDDKLPDTISGEEYEASADYFDFEFVSIPKDLVKSFKDVFKYINKNAEDLDEVIGVNDISLSIDGFEIKFPELEKLYNGINNLKEMTHDNTGDGKDSEEKGFDGEPMVTNEPDSPTGSSFV